MPHKYSPKGLQRRKAKKHRWDKEKPLPFKNTLGIVDLTPVGAVRIMRGEPDQVPVGRAVLNENLGKEEE